MQRAGLRATVGGVQVDVPTGTWTNGQALRYNAGIIDTSPLGDVVGPGAAVNGNIASFNGTTGKLIQDSGVSATAHAARHNPGGADAMFTGTWAANDVAQWGGAAWVQKVVKAITLGAQQSITTTTPATITGLSLTLPRAATYYIDVTLFVTQSANTAVGYGFNLSSGFSSCSFMAVHPRSTTTDFYGGRTTANNTANVDTRTTAALTLPVRLVGNIVSSAGGGTLSVVGQRATVNTVTVEVGSTFLIMEL